ncbi:MAG TPA: hypothetical protein VGE68_10665 [Sphingomicrobium sp.]
MSLFIRASTLCSAAAAIAMASPALAVVGGPAIAYALTSGQTQSIYLANPDGSGTVKIYTGGSKVGINQIDIRPGGNQMAILESSIAGGQGILKIINYSDAGVRQSVTTVDSGNCQIVGVDYHPTDGSLLATRHCNTGAIQELRRYYPANSAWAGDPLVSYNGNVYGGKARWLNDGSGFLWVVSDAANGGGRIDRYDLTNTSAPVTVWRSGSNGAPSFFDVQRCGPSQTCDRMLVTTPYGGEIHEVSFSGGGTDFGKAYGPNTSDGHYSPDNAHILWWRQVQGGSSFMIDNQVFVKGSGSKDWRQ